ncbi:hypothetical protein ACWCQQ_50955, partial [Streptomyces sp. NPDC002143]
MASTALAMFFLWIDSLSERYAGIRLDGCGAATGWWPEGRGEAAQGHLPRKSNGGFRGTRRRAAMIRGWHPQPMGISTDFLCGLYDVGGWFVAESKGFIFGSPSLGVWLS